MAAEFPVDITAEYAGNTNFGVPADAKTGYAFKIKLNEKAVWENGDIINADSYIYSMQQILNPEIKNYRASSYYSGTLTIANSEAYYKQNEPIYTNIMVDGAYRQAEDKDMKFSFTKEIVFFGDSAKSYYDGGSTASHPAGDFPKIILTSGDPFVCSSNGTLSKEAMNAGSKMHRKLQKMAGSYYDAEVPLKITMKKGIHDLDVTVEGRADGIIDLRGEKNRSRKKKPRPTKRSKRRSKRRPKRRSRRSRNRPSRRRKT